MTTGLPGTATAEHAAVTAALPETTPAAVLRNGAVVVERVPVPTPGPGELLVAVDLATVCAADRAAVHTGGPDRVLGHEGIGRVLVAGPGTTAHARDRVVWASAVSCGRCDRCRGGRSAACRKLRRIGEHAIDSAWPLSGAFAGHLLLPRGATVVPVPEVLCDAVAAPTSCAAATVMAALDAAGSLRGARVLIAGAGMLGLTAAAVATDRSASSVVVVDRDASRRALARAFGATESLVPGAALPDVDVALTFGSPSSEAFGALALGGRLVVIGDAGPAAAGAGDELALDTRRLASRWLAVAGVRDAEPRHLADAVAYLVDARERWPWEQLVSPAMPLSSLPTLLDRPSPIAPRAAVQPRR